MEQIPEYIQDAAEEYCPYEPELEYLKKAPVYGTLDQQKAYIAGRLAEREYQQQQMAKMLNWIMEKGYEWSNWSGKGPYWFNNNNGGRLKSTELIEIWNATNQDR